MQQNNSPVVETQMLIRKSVAIVFEAFIDPSITTQFWFTKSSGRLVTGTELLWEWEMYNASAKVFVKEIEQNKKISIEWGVPATTVDFHFNALSDDTTYVIIKNYGFDLQNEELIKSLIDSTAGFTTVLDGLKAYLEHGINLNLIADKFPKTDI